VKGEVILSAAFHAFTTPASDPPGQLEIYQPLLNRGPRVQNLQKDSTFRLRRSVHGETKGYIVVTSEVF
jgi:hypothetical protein